MARALPRPIVWFVRLASLAMVVTGVFIGWQKWHSTDEQDELVRYVEHQVPAYLERERAVYDRLAELEHEPGPSPPEARKLLVDDVIPKLIALKASARSVVAKSGALKQVNEEYLAYLDRLIEACRVSVRSIDDPAVDGAAANKLIRQRFREAGEASQRWSVDLRNACIKAGLSPPPAQK